ncbi:RNA chaperone Hfq [Desulfoglaeba alkanexedens]|uniref:Uncharacterized protein n=1 Tax=Desulfoglaeba alkanexedens ALDC TaxID=980445 RepID=A0A4P8L5W1_9BACT|nr:RNA chaperone Hfq [Desulfoglaeba alkanexedens]QCQ23284.1 hypothetical protein FDQ92_14550 [Desulfoglaeba alkanexedens ALDC]
MTGSKGNTRKSTPYVIRKKSAEAKPPVQSKPAVESKPAESKSQRPRNIEPDQSLEGKNIRLWLMPSGKAVDGVMERVAVYTVVLRQGTGPQVVYKHAIERIEEA